MRAFAIFIFFIMAFTPYSNELTNNTYMPSETGRQAVHIRSEFKGISDNNSVIGKAVFGDDTDANHPSPTLSKIYRTLSRHTDDGDAFETLDSLLNRQLYGIYAAPGNVLVPYLLSNESVYTSDEKLHKKLSEITENYIFSKHTDTMNYRLIALNEIPSNDKQSMALASWHYFVQVWNDKYIWAQPICEGTEYKFNQAYFIDSANGDELLLLCGRADRHIGSSFSVVGTGFIFNDGIWSTVNWNDLFEQVNSSENLNYKIGSDGFSMTYYDSSMRYMLMLPQPHESPLYLIKLTEDGSFLADFSAFKDYPANKGLPDYEVLFKIKK